MKHNGFALIELLVVVAIIGILAAVGVVAYSGYTSGAKKQASISNHKSVCKWVSAEAMKIGLGIDSLFDGNITASSILSDYSSGGNPMGKITQAIVNASKDRFKNPYGEGGSSKKIIRILEKLNYDNLLKKAFFNIPIKR